MGKIKKIAVVLAVLLMAGLVVVLIIHHAREYRGPSHFPKTAWVSAGAADPVSALETACYATVQGDGKTMLASLTPELQAPLQKAWEKSAKAQGMTLEDFFASKTRKFFDDVLGFRVLGLKNVNDHQALVQVYVQGWWFKVTFNMRKIGSEWKVAGLRRG